MTFVPDGFTTMFRKIRFKDCTVNNTTQFKKLILDINVHSACLNQHSSNQINNYNQY